MASKKGKDSMSMHNRENRLKELQIKNKRTQIIKELSEYVVLSEDSFVNVAESKLLCLKAIQKAEETSSYLEFDKDANFIMQKILEIKQMASGMFGKEIVLFQHDYVNTGALTIDLRDFWQNINVILDLSKVVEGRGQFIAVGKELEYALCILRLEYNYRLVTWGMY